ncbi:heavy metal translocating P-type ATPase [Psychrobacter aquaticus]|uniref:Lead, cadmium, zinc and mercury transporting ATPase n=1 Tax=Psychrobacter aquaticus CMS 56 TaxID=1354303 RepID=U4TDX6_9GAMM|nr:cation-translocating P-type ATPase [Psychrobacter aquaticus]ERL56653.1 Lead, cadmium, zinc and mercury transporting ATPase [Psychrobacter aquaticus CMS 56]
MNNSTHTDNHNTYDVDTDIQSDTQIAPQRAHLQLAIDGMTCQACASRIEKVLNKKPSVYEVSVNFAGETANVDYDPTQTTPEQVTEWVNKTGFVANLQAADSLFSQTDEDIATQYPWRLIGLWICLVPFLIGMAGMLTGLGMAWMPPIWLQFVLATLVQFGFGLPFYKSAWASIKGGLANMDVLVVIGTVTIWAYSTYLWLTHGDGSLNSLLQSSHAGGHGASDGPAVYFEAGVMVIAFVRTGKYLEERTKKHSLNSIDLLLSLTPDEVEQQQANGDFHNVALKDVQVGDILRAKQGSRVATDGSVIDGSGWCVESHLTGESVPLKKDVGDGLLAGALVENGSLLYRVSAKGSDTKLGDMVQALSDAQGSKANLARFADRVTAIFVPVVVAIALVTFGLTWWLTGMIDTALMHAVSVLVIACPCALGLATPAAIMAGMGVAARHGVWFKDAQSLEAAGSIDTVVLDKTGTLTIGKPTIVNELMVDKSLAVDDVLQIAASVEAHASHPLATALINAATARQLPLLTVNDISVVKGAGIQANIEGLGLVKVGTAEFANLILPKLMPKVWNIASTVAISINDEPLGAFALADDLKVDTPRAITALQDAGINVILMSGDKQSVVDHVAGQLGIDKAYGKMSPRDKASQIALLQTAGHKVAMAGDGVNDAPAMATADASFAMFEGTDVAQHSASARLMGESLMHIDAAQKIAQATLRNIKQNLFFAFIYNCLGIPLAAFGFLNPMIAAAAMALSSISVLMNALRLTRFKTEVELENTVSASHANKDHSAKV